MKFGLCIITGDSCDRVGLQHSYFQDAFKHQKIHRDSFCRLRQYKGEYGVRCICVTAEGLSALGTEVEFASLASD